MNTVFTFILCPILTGVFYTQVFLIAWPKRVRQHRNNECQFTSRYKCYDLVYFEEYTGINVAIRREKQLKRWRRQWKIELIRKMNPQMKDLYPEIA